LFRLGATAALLWVGVGFHTDAELSPMWISRRRAYG